jgi:hypothetical protein
LIEDTWSLDEILDIAELDELEAAGQAKRLVGRICAEIHNAVRNYGWMRHADKNTPPPTPLDESRWLPRRAKRKARKSRDEKQLTQAEVVSQKITQAFSDWW